MAVQPCVRCRNEVAVGAVRCPHCGAEHPHRNRPVRAAAAVRRRMVVIGCVVLAVVVYVVLSFVQVGGGKERTAACRAFDEAQAKYEQAVSTGEDVPTDLTAQLERLRKACDVSER